MATNKSPVKPAKKVEFNTFVQGLITEASPLNFPINASVDELNFDLNRDGTRDRRRGMDFETPYEYRMLFTPIANYNEFQISTYLWKSPGGFVDDELVVIQFGFTLYFYDNQKSSLSTQGLLGAIDLSESTGINRFSYATVNGRLVVADGTQEFFVVNYDGDVSFTYATQRIRVRDQWGLPEEDPLFELHPELRPSTLSAAHYYNLRNQGWYYPRQGEIIWIASNPPLVVENPGSVDPVAYFNVKVGNYPSNEDNIYLGLAYQPAIPGVVNRPSEQMISALYSESRGSGVIPAKGFFVIDFLNRGAERPPQYGADLSPGGPKCVTSFAGRAFFSGFSGEVIQGNSRSPSIESFVLFSQLVKKDNDISKCYQEGDPTARESSEIVDTDGGFIRISGASNIIAMRPLGSSIIVFASNGVWQISGGSDYGFTATNYKVTKLSSVGIYSESSIVEEVGKIYFWSLDGIYVVGSDQFQTTGVQNIVQANIQTFYDTIPTVSKTHAVGAFDTFSKKVRWIYQIGEGFTDGHEIRELVFDTALNAFYPSKISNINNSITIPSLFLTPPFRVGDFFTELVANGDEVVVDGEQVVVRQTARISGLQSIKYLAMVNNAGVLNFTFSTYSNEQFIDFEKADGVGEDAKAYMLTGSQIAGDSSVAKQIPYLTMHFRRTETGFDIDGSPANPSSCFVRSQWNFSNSIKSNKWGSLFQAYRYNTSNLVTDLEYDTGFALVTSKSKLRGRGKSFSMYVESEALKDLRIVGWNLAVNGNSVT